MSAYRQAPAQSPVAPRTPWWRIIRAWITGSLKALPSAIASRAALAEYRKSEAPLMRGMWIPRGYALSRSAIIASLPKSLRPMAVDFEKTAQVFDEASRAVKTRAQPPPKGPQPLPVNITE